MATNRAAKSGFAHEAQQKVKSKWSSESAIAAFNWISSSLGDPSISTNGTMEDCHEKLKNGFILCKFANWVTPGSVPAKNLNTPATMAFKQMEAINLFLKAIEKYVKKIDQFQTVDLYEAGNMVQVITTIEALGRALVPEKRGYGVAESKGEKREFTEEQLKAGQNVIGLQMGSNKGASQAGQNFGKSRMIVD